MIQEVTGNRNISFLSAGFSGNSCLMFVIITDINLHTPKYIAVFNLSLTDNCENTAVIPQLLDAVLFGNQLISYGLCMSNMLFVSVQSQTLTVLSFDSLVAICLPLRYHMIVSHRSMLVMIGALWTLALMQTITAAVFMTRLSFCRTSVIILRFCDHRSVFPSCVIISVLFQFFITGNTAFQTTSNLTSIQSNSSANETFVRPATFFLNGFSNVPHAKYYYVFLCFVYAVTVLGNSFIMCIIYLARRLHTAKYIAVFHLAISDLCGSSALIPKLIDTFLFEHQEISYEECLMNMFFVFHFMNVQSLTLLALAYDRLVAICFPLKYHAVITKTSMSFIIGSMWIFSVTFFAVLVSLVNRLSFCRTNVVNSYFCDHGPVISLSCNSNFINYLLAYICVGLLICMPVILVTLTYCCIAAALLKIAHGADRIKAMKTCTSHLMLVAIFYLPILSVNVKSISTSIDQNSRIINNSLTQIIPPMLNPIIYTLKTEEVMQSIKEMYKRRKVNTISEKNVKQRK
ncbi:hypothetical protein PO909_022749 [Leuciscus waleckii]